MQGGHKSEDHKEGREQIMQLSGGGTVQPEGRTKGMSKGKKSKNPGEVAGSLCRIA